MSDLSPLLYQKFFTQDGKAPLAGGKVWSYEAGTTTPLETFTDDSGLTPCTNPIILDANGETSFYIGDTAYKFVILDSSDVVQRTIDNVLSLRAQIAAAINSAGALAVVNNLSDVASKSTSLVNLGIAPFQTPVPHAITSGQSAANLLGESFDGATYMAIFYTYVIKYGTTIFASGNFALHYKNGTWIYVEGSGGGDAHGITFSLTQATTVGQLQAAELGLGDANVVLKRHFVFA